jgi:hypothetical protein
MLLPLRRQLAEGDAALAAVALAGFDRALLLGRAQRSASAIRTVARFSSR